METPVKTAEIVKAGMLMPVLMPSPASNLPVLQRKDTAVVSPKAFLAKLAEIAKGISAIQQSGMPQGPVSEVKVRRVPQPKQLKQPQSGGYTGIVIAPTSQPKTYQRPNKGFD